MMLGIGIGIGIPFHRAPAGGSLDYAKLAILGDSTIARAFRSLNTDGIYYSGTEATVGSLDTPRYYKVLAGNRVFGFDNQDPPGLATYTVSDVDLTTYGDPVTPALVVPYTGTGASYGVLHCLSQLSAMSFINSWNARNGCPVDLTLAGASGLFAASLSDLIADVITPTDCGIVVIAAGVNDLAWATATPAQVLTYLADAVATLRAQGRRVVLSTVLPYGTEPAKTDVETLNASIRALTFDSDFVLLDAYDVIDDGAGGQLAGRTHDGVHYSPLGADEVATELQTVVAGWSLPSRANDILATTADEGLVNGDFSGTGGTHGGAYSTGTLADGWGTSRTGTLTTMVASQTARGDGEGNDQTLTITTTGAGTATLRTDSIHASYTPGTEIYAVAEVSISGLGSQFQALRFGVIATDVDGVQVTTEWGVTHWGSITGDDGGQLSITAAQAPQGDRTYTIKTPPVAMTDSLTNLRLAVSIEFLGAVTNAVMTVGRATIYEVA